MLLFVAQTLLLSLKICTVFDLGTGNAYIERRGKVLPKINSEQGCEEWCRHKIRRLVQFKEEMRNKYRNIRRFLLLAMLPLGLLSSACATITTGTTQSVSVVTEKSVEGAKCELTDSKVGCWFISDLPGTVEATVQ